MNHICATNRPASVAVDHGKEFRAGLQEALASYNIALEATSPYIKSSTSSVECSIRLLKRALKRVCLYDPSTWDKTLPMILDAVNNSTYYGRTTRNHLFFSPSHFVNRLQLMGTSDFPEHMFDRQYSELNEVIMKRRANLKKLHTPNQTKYKIGGLVTDHYIPRTHQKGESAELHPSVNGIYRIITALPKRLRVINVITGEERTIPVELARPLYMESLLQLRLSLEHLYVRNHNDRLMSENSFVPANQKRAYTNLMSPHPTQDSLDDPSLYQEQHQAQDEEQHQHQEREQDEEED